MDTITIRLNKETHKKLKLLAVSNELSITKMVDKLVTSCKQNRDKTNPNTD